MSRTFLHRAALAGLIGAGLAAGTAHAEGMRLVASDSTPWAYETVTVRATIDHPRRMGVQLLGWLAGGDATVTCTRGGQTATRTVAVARTVVKPLPPTIDGADQCTVVARGIGPDGVTVHVYAS